jgi:hypothetical protein
MSEPPSFSSRQNPRLNFRIWFEQGIQFRFAPRFGERQFVGARETLSSEVEVPSQSLLGEPDAVLQPVADQGGDGL